MNLPEHLKSKSAVELEEWFLEGLEADPVPATEMLTVLAEVYRAGAGAQAVGWAELLQDALAEGGLREHALHLLRLRADWHGDGEAFRHGCREAAAKTFPDRMGQGFVESVGFDNGLPIHECLRRLEVLHGLRPDRLCHDKTWGLGVVKRLDDFYKKVTIDFRRKPGHQMSFAYAAETLELIGDEHLQARLYRDEAGLKALVKEDPAEVVRIALRSHGPLTAEGLKELLTDGIVEEAAWKAFWDQARKDLKRDALVEMPARRSEPMRLLRNEKEYGEAWFEALAGERDPEAVLAKVLELEDSGKSIDLPVEFRTVLGKRLGFVVWSAEDSAPPVAARAALVADRLGLGDVGFEPGATAGKLRKRRRLARVLHGLPAREVGAFVGLLAREDRDATVAALVEALPGMAVSVLNSVIGFLREVDADTACAGCVREELGERDPPVTMLYWCCRNLPLFDAWNAGSRADLLKQVFDAMQRSRSGDQLKAQNQLRTLVRQQAWLAEVLAPATEQQRRALMAQLNSAQGWDPAERRSVMAAMIKLYPELGSVVGGNEREEEERPTGRWTSRRSYTERQAQLRRLIEVEIPANSREIGIARSYGDLRENAEYQAAKDHQAILMRRKAEIENDLKEVRATDFRGFSAEKAGMGTCVTLEREDGETLVFNLLGEWDRDEELSIISSQSRLARVLDGKTAGDRVVLPGNDEGVSCRVVRVAPLGDEVRAWIEGREAPELETGEVTG